MWQINRSIKIIRTKGIGAWLSATKQYLDEKKESKNMNGNSFEHWNYIIDYVKYERKPFLSKPKKGESIVINWIIPPFGEGSGGHLNIFRYIYNLEKLGCFNRIYIFGQTNFGSGNEAKAFIRKHFFPLNSDVYLSTNNIADSDALFATSWETAYVVNSIGNTSKKFYFIQDYEPYFYSLGSESLFAQQTYFFDFHRITMGPWIMEHLQKTFNLKSSYLDFGYDPSVYGAKPPDFTRPSNHHVFLYARPVTSRRCFELGVLALKEVFERGIDLEIYMIGQEIRNYNLPFPHHTLGILTSYELAKLYSNTDLGVVFSPTNTSLLPFEMMASGCAVIELNSPSNQSTFPNLDIIKLVNPSPIAIADAIEELLTNNTKLKTQIKKAYEHVKPFTWEKSAMKLMTIIKDELET